MAPRLGRVASLGASVAVVVAVVAIALLAHGRTRHLTGAGHGAGARGEILSQGGSVLAVSQAVFDVQIDLAKLPPSATARSQLYRRLAQIVGTPTRPSKCPTRGHLDQRLASIPCAVALRQAQGNTAAVTVAFGASSRAERRIAADAGELPGVSTRRVYQRAYPAGDLAAQVIGTVSPISPAERGTTAGRELSPQSVVGQTGLEYEYDRFLRSSDNLQTSLNERLQRTGQQALQHAIVSNHGTGGAFVAIDPENGSVYAMGSLPTVAPSRLGLSQSSYRKLLNPTSGYPLLNRAIQSAGPTGSTFSPVTALSGLQSGAWTPNELYDDTATFCVARQCRRNPGGAAYGPLSIQTALKVTSNNFFVNLGARTNRDPNTHPAGGPLDQTARAFGIGQATGIDLPAAVNGTLPTPKWRAARNRLEQQCDHATGPFAGKRQHPPGGCGIADGANRPWSIGDNINLAVGQGDLQVSPLQLAVTYAAIANGGTIVHPHIADMITSPDGTVIQKIAPPPLRPVNLKPAYLQTVRAGLRAAASQPGGTSDDVFGNFAEQVYGTAGTAQSTGQTDYAWYAGYVPASATTKPIAVVVWVQQGGFGTASAAPVARQILSQWFTGKKGPWKPGTSISL
jgi:penicillin-binding protein 2